MTPNRQQLRRLRQAMLRATAEYYERRGTTCIDDIPLLVPITGACENVSTLYSLVAYPGHYLTQTGQLSLEVELQYYESVCCVIRSFRADQADSRHLNEFTLVEEEFAWSKGSGMASYDPAVLLDHLLIEITAVIRAMLVGALEQSDMSNTFNLDPTLARSAVSFLDDRHAKTWPIVTYREALGLLNDSGLFGALTFGLDFRQEHETALVDIVSSQLASSPVPVFITRYPELIKFFNMKVDPNDPAVVLSADLVLPVSGEAVGAAVREDDPTKLLRRLEASSMVRHISAAHGHGIRDFESYLSIMESGRVPAHAGYGIGLERVVQFVLGVEDIRTVSGVFGLLSELQVDDLAGPRGGT